MNGHTKISYTIHTIVRIAWFAFMFKWSWNMVKFQQITYFQSLWIGLSIYFVYWFIRDLNTIQQRRDYTKANEELDNRHRKSLGIK